MGGDQGWLRGSDEDVARRLQAELDRVASARDLFSVLGLAPSADSAAIRAAFLTATKQFHPNLFARRPAEIAEQSNELFLLINRAYRKLTTEPRGTASRPIQRKRRSSSVQSTYQTAIPISPDGEVLSRSSAAARRAGAPAQPSKPADQVATRIAFNAPAKTARTHSGTRPSGRSLAARRAARRNPTARSAAAVASKQPPGKPVEARNRGVVVDRVERREQARQDKFEAAVALLNQGKPGPAREAFRELAVNNPATKKFRVYMHYAWGHEYQAQSQPKKAVAEYNRALKLDPTFNLAADAVRALQAPAKKPRLFSKLFKRD